MALSGAYSNMGLKGSITDGYNAQTPMSLSDSLQQGYSNVSAGQSGADPMSMAGGFQANSDSMGVIKSSDIKSGGFDFGGATQDLGKALMGASKNMGKSQTEWGTFTAQPKLSYNMEQGQAQTIGGNNQMYRAMQQYANSLPTKMQYPSYHGGK